MLKMSLPEYIADNELLLRAVLPKAFFWKEGRLSSAALKDGRGLSVDRTYDRSIEESVIYMRQNLDGDIVSIKPSDCRKVNAVVRYRPTKNIFHCEIHGSEEKIVLSPKQAKELALCAEVVYRATITTT